MRTRAWCGVHRVRFDLPTDVPVPAEIQASLEGIKHFVSQLRTTFPDLHYTIELQVAEGDMVVTRMTARGTPTREYWDLGFKSMPPTGKQVRWTETHISRITDGRIVEQWSNQDDVGRMQQVGALPMGAPVS